MKKIGLFFCSILVALCSVVVPRAGADTVCAEEAFEPTPIDMYLIGGQSNAAGYSRIGANTTETFENVAYSGITEVNFRNGSGEAVSTAALDYSNIKWQVTGGLGTDSAKIGPEYGMAKVLNQYYTGDKKAFIFKTAAGGTSLLDKTRELSERMGNWYPRSLWEEGYTPNIRQNIVGNDATGILYEFFVENFRKVYNGLVANGYAPQVKGMVWMQGETDLYGDYEQYGDTLKTFISDIREDIFEITNDEDAKAMPFVIGKIAPSFAAWNNGNVPKIHAQQERVAKEMSGVATISTDDLIIVREDGTINGTDKYHFNFQDATTLGCRFGEKVWELADLKYVAVTAVNGKLTYKYDENDNTKIIFYLTPDEHYTLKRITVNGKDETANVSGNSLTVISDRKQTIAEAEFVLKVVATAVNGKLTYKYDENDDTKIIFYLTPDEHYKLKRITVNGKDETANVSENSLTVISDGKQTIAEAEFVQKEKYSVSYEMDEKNVGIVRGSEFVYEGDTAKFTFGARKGYKITKVTVNGAEIASEKEGEYFYGKAENVSGNLSVAVEIEKIASDNGDTANENNKGCKGVMSIPAAGLLLMGLSVIGFAVKKTKR